MSRAVLAWLVLCGSLAAPRLARGERQGRGRVGSRLSRSRSPSARGPGAGRGVPPPRLPSYCRLQIKYFPAFQIADQRALLRHVLFRNYA